jgi:diguanylate cyclase (GGDEF)-like protein
MAVVSVRLGWKVYSEGLPTGTTEMSAEQALMRATGMIYLAISGLCFLVLTSRELVSRRRVDTSRDRLTGTFSRSGLDLNLAIEMERSSRSGQPFSIALVQIDQISRILEVEGRPAANTTLREVAEAIAGQLRSTDQLGRYSGDLFLMVLSQTTHQEALIVAQRVSDEAAKLKALADSQPISLTLGITESSPGDNGDKIIARAEQALFLATAESPNCTRVVLERAGIATTEDKRVSAVA